MKPELIPTAAPEAPDPDPGPTIRIDTHRSVATDRTWWGVARATLGTRSLVVAAEHPDADQAVATAADKLTRWIDAELHWAWVPEYNDGGCK